MLNIPSTGNQSWDSIDWPHVKSTVKNYQTAIFNAAQSGDKARLFSLQKSALKSKCVLLMAIKRVTISNKGKSTPGFDNQVYLNPARR